MMMTKCIHFINWTTPDQYWNAVRIWGKPDFVHRFWDERAKFGGEIAPDDVLVFFKGTESDAVKPFAFNDSEHTQWVQNLLKGKSINAND